MKTAVLFCLMGTAAIAQTTVYLEPLVYKKVQVCGNSYSSLSSTAFVYNNDNVANPYFDYEPKKLSTRPSINIGLSAIVGLQNNKHLLSLQYATDEAGTMGKMSVLETQNYYGSVNPPVNPPYHAITYFLNSGFTISRLTLGYSGLVTRKSVKSKLYLNGDVTLFFTSPIEFEYVWDDTTSQNQRLYYNDSRLITTALKSSIPFERKVLALGAGAKCDLGMSWKKRWHYFFTVDVNYRIGLNKVMGSGTIVEVIDGKTNEHLYFSYGLESKGSGLYFQLSRRFQLVPWKKN